MSGAKIAEMISTPMKTMPTIARVVEHVAPGLAQKPGRRLELDLVGFDFGDAHGTRILGLMRA